MVHVFCSGYKINQTRDWYMYVDGVFQAVTYNCPHSHTLTVSSHKAQTDQRHHAPPTEHPKSPPHINLNDGPLQELKSMSFVSHEC